MYTVRILTDGLADDTRYEHEVSAWRGFDLSVKIARLQPSGVETTVQLIDTDGTILDEETRPAAFYDN